MLKRPPTEFKACFQLSKYHVFGRATATKVGTDDCGSAGFPP